MTIYCTMSCLEQERWREKAVRKTEEVTRRLEELHDVQHGIPMLQLPGKPGESDGQEEVTRRLAELHDVLQKSEKNPDDIQALHKRAIEGRDACFKT